MSMFGLRRRTQSTSGEVGVRMDGGEGPLLGQAHQLMVEHLLGQLRRLQAGEAVPRVVVLRAESGTGKSRIVRELYERMRRSQPVGDGGDGYWPALVGSLPGPGGHGEVLPVRKRIGPDLGGFARGAGAVPSFAWWTVTCERREGGDIVEVNLEMGQQMRAHARYLVRAWKERAEPAEKVETWLRQEWKTLAGQGAIQGGAEGIGALLSELGPVVPGVGVAVDAGIAAGRRWWETRITSRRVAAGGALDDDPLTTPEEIYRQLSRLAHPQLPMVLAVEDLHFMGDGLAGLLTLLAQPNRAWPVLVVATAWPEGYQEPVYANWIEQATTTGQDAPALAEVVDLAGLDSEALGELLRRHAPRTDDTTAERVVSAWPNPYGLQLMLTDPGVAATSIIDGALRVTEEEIRDLPGTVEDWYRRRWTYLPAQVRQALMIAAGCQPAEACDAPASWPFLRKVVAGAAARAGLLDTPDQIEEALGDAADPHEWSRITDTDLGLEHFREWVQARIATDHQSRDRRYRGPTLLQAATAELEAWIETRTHVHGYLLDPDEPATLTACRWLLTVAAGQPPSEARSVAAFAIARAQATVHRYHAALATLDQAGFPRGLDPSAPDTLSARNEQALWQLELGRLEEATVGFERVLADREQVLGADHPDTLTSGNNLAGAYWSAGDLGRAIPLYEQTLADTQRVLGADHPDTLTSRNNLAYVYESAGDLARAIPLHEQTLADRERVLGADHPDTLTSRNNLAGAYESSGDLGRAIPLYEQTLADRERVLGADHPDTLRSRNNLAGAYSSAGDLGRAIPLYEQTRADRERVLGTDHPDTLASGNNLAGAYWSAGDLGRAIPLLEKALADRERVLGTDHPDTLTSRNNLAYAYSSAGDLGRAIPLHEQTLADRERVLGADHPDTLTSRNKLAGVYESAGDLGRAIPLYEQTLADRERVLGADHPATLASRNNLAGVYSSAGDLGRAIPLHEQTLADRERVLGADHPATLASRNNLAGAYESAGDLGRAIPLYEQTLADTQRVLGADHPDTLTSRNNLAGAYSSAGDLGRAIPLYEQTLADRERVLGADHPDTLTSRNNLAGAYESAGDLGRAIPLYEQTLADRERVLGADHPDTLTSAEQPGLRVRVGRGPGPGDPAVRADAGRHAAGAGCRPPGHADVAEQPGLRVLVGRGPGPGDPAVRADPGRPGAGAGCRPPGHADVREQPGRRVLVGGGPGPGDPAVRADPGRPGAGAGCRPPGHAEVAEQPGLRVLVGGGPGPGDPAVRADPGRPGAGAGCRPPGHADVTEKPGLRVLVGGGPGPGDPAVRADAGRLRTNPRPHSSTDLHGSPGPRNCPQAAPGHTGRAPGDGVGLAPARQAAPCGPRVPQLVGTRRAWIGGLTCENAREGGMWSCVHVAGSAAGGVCAGQAGSRAVTTAGAGTWQAATMPAWVVVSGVVCTTLPALPTRVTAWTRFSSVAMRCQVMPVRRSATRTSSRASQQSRTWARMRGSRRWNTGRNCRVDFMSRKPRSASSRFL